MNVVPHMKVAPRAQINEKSCFIGQSPGFYPIVGRIPNEGLLIAIKPDITFSKKIITQREQ